MGAKQRLRKERREQHVAPPQPRRVSAFLIVAALAGAATLGYLEYRARQPQPRPSNVAVPPPMAPPPFRGRGRGARGEPAIPGMTINDDISVILNTYGKPDTDESTAGMNPPPPIVTRRITYARQHVTVVYRQDGDTWRLVGFVDPDTHRAIAASLAAERMNANR